MFAEIGFNVVIFWVVDCVVVDVSALDVVLTDVFGVSVRGTSVSGTSASGTSVSGASVSGAPVIPLRLSSSFPSFSSSLDSDERVCTGAGRCDSFYNLRAYSLHKFLP